MFYTWEREGAGDGQKIVELLSQDYSTTAEAVIPSLHLGSFECADYLPPSAAVLTAPTDVAHMCIGSENAGYVRKS